MRLKSWAVLFLAAGLAGAAGHLAAAGSPDDEKTVVHVLNRVAFGARPGDVDKVRQLGVRAFVEQQLHPERIDDSAVTRRLAELETVGLSSREISERYERPLMEARRDQKQRAAASGSQDTAPPPRMPVQQQANLVVAELSEQKLLRAVYSERQLQEVLADFWFNHFNVDARKGRDRFLLTEYEREAIRPHVLGKFRDLLGATAQSPAMLFYLDNWLSANPNGPHPAGSQRARAVPRTRSGSGLPRRPAPAMPAPDQNAGQRNRRNGLNENYARELMELHTLGVDGGYAQKDVTEVARAFTGWTIDNPRQGGRFHFEPRIHDDGEKNVLGHRIKSGGGQRDGEQVLDILAAHPSTAHFIATKLARRFVADAPPPALVDRLAARFASTGGDLRAVMTELLTSPEFLSPDSYRAKVKSPFEFVVSAVRATGAELPNARPLVKALQDLGQPLYQCQPPTGYKDVADAWTNTGALVTRMNFALALAAGRTRETTGDRRDGDAIGPPPASAAGRAVRQADVAAWPDRVEAVLAHDLSDATRATIAKASAASDRAALALGSPEFQRR